MASILKKLKQIAQIINLWQWIFSLIPSIMTFFSKVRTIILELFPEKKLPDWFLVILGVLLSVVLVLIFWNRSLRKTVESLTKFKVKYGVYWDAELNPYCPICRTPLVLEQLSSTEVIARQISPLLPKPRPRLYCSKCKSYYALVNESGISISLAQAKEDLKSQMNN